VTPAAPSAVVLGSRWRAHDTELAFVTRTVASALSRRGAVTVLTPSPAGTTEPDGAFDLVGIGVGPEGGWPEPATARWDHLPDPTSTWILDEPGENARALFEAFGPAAGYSVTAVPEDSNPALRTLPLTPASATEDSAPVGLHVPINPLANTSRHTGFGFTGYVLVLTDRAGDRKPQPPPDAAAWLTTRFFDSYIVVLENGRAAAWKGRALRGVVGVDTRTDLWRLLAHAVVTVDLAPGPIVGRECIESLRFGTPIVVPQLSAAAAHARAGGGRTFTGAADLLDAVELLSQEPLASAVGATGRRYAEELYGDAAGFVKRIDRMLRAA
jgi:hypothetical protein